jgi:plasmid stabilization system protein ParE
VVQVIWSKGALANVEAITSYIAGFSPLAAQRMALRLYRAGDSLSEFPNRGRPISKGRRELTIVYPYVIRYRVYGERVGILSVRHGARRPAP